MEYEPSLLRSLIASQRFLDTGKFLTSRLPGGERDMRRLRYPTREMKRRERIATERACEMRDCGVFVPIGEESRHWTRPLYLPARYRFVLGYTESLLWSPPAVPPDIDPIVGVVYAFQGPNGLVKIGHTSNWENRRGALLTNCPPPRRVLRLHETDDCRYIETELHGMFHDRRIGGEWFDVPAEEIIAAFDDLPG